MSSDTARVRLSSDDEAHPEPDVAHQHDEADEEDQEDGLVVRRGAGLLYLDQGRVVHDPGVETVLILTTSAWCWGSRGQLLTLIGSVELHPLQLDPLLIIHSVRLLVEDVVVGEGVLGSGQVELGDESQPDGHGSLSVPHFVTRVQI